jgi:hypothetical protein
VFLHHQWITVILQWLNFHKHQLLQYDEQYHALIDLVNNLPMQSVLVNFYDFVNTSIRKSGCVS